MDSQRLFSELSLQVNCHPVPIYVGVRFISNPLKLCLLKTYPEVDRLSQPTQLQQTPMVFSSAHSNLFQRGSGTFCSYTIPKLCLQILLLTSMVVQTKGSSVFIMLFLQMAFIPMSPIYTAPSVGQTMCLPFYRRRN